MTKQYCHCCCTHCHCWPIHSHHHARKLAFWGGFVLFWSLAFLAIAIVVPIIIHKIQDEGFRSIIYLLPGTKGFNSWQDNGASPIRLDVYVYDILNSREALAGAKPVVLERGPFVYWKHSVKFNLSWTSDQELLSFKSWDRLYFDPELSAEPDIEAVITTLNFGYLGLRALAVGLAPLQSGLLKLAMVYAYETGVPTSMHDRIFKNMTVRQMIFGYEDPVLRFLVEQSGQNISPVFPGFLFNMTTQALADDHFFPSQVWTGVNHEDVIRQYVLFNGVPYAGNCLDVCPPSLPAYAWSSLNVSWIHGGDGSQFPPRLSKDSRPPVFDSTCGRSFAFEYTGETDVKGISTYRYILPSHYYQSASSNPRNAAFDQFFVDGFFNISRLSKGVPTLLSKPHLDGVQDETVLHSLHLLAPCTDDAHQDHVSFFDIEPMSGITMRAVGRTQINLQISPWDAPGGKVWFPSLRPVTVPVLWVSQTGEVPDAQASDFVSTVYPSLALQQAAQIVGYVMCGVLGFIGLAMVFYGTHQHHHYRRNPNAKRENSALLASNGEAAEGGSPTADDFTESATFDGRDSMTRRDLGIADINFSAPAFIAAPLGSSAAAGYRKHRNSRLSLSEPAGSGAPSSHTVSSSSSSSASSSSTEAAVPSSSSSSSSSASMLGLSSHATVSERPEGVSAASSFASASSSASVPPHHPAHPAMLLRANSASLDPAASFGHLIRPARMAHNNTVYSSVSPLGTPTNRQRSDSERSDYDLPPHQRLEGNHSAGGSSSSSRRGSRDDSREEYLDIREHEHEHAS